MLKKLKNIKWGYPVISILLAVIGACFITFNNSLTVLAISVGVILAVFGAIFGVVTISGKKRGFYFAVKIIFAVICLAAGIVTAVFRENSTEVLISLFSLLIIVDGSFKLNTSAVSKRYSVGGWWIMMILSAAIIASAFLLVERTPEKESLTTTVLGIIILADAVANLLSVFWVAKNESAEKAEIYYDVCQEIKGKDNEN